ncbi:MAG: hypothetical protein IPG91_15650 [Ideonella sp.]|nr:hypothetical protein [Ideonella sp.]
MVEWLGHAAPGADPDDGKPVLRLRHLLGVLDRNPGHRASVVALLAAFFDGVDAAALFADFGFTARRSVRRARRAPAPARPAGDARDDRPSRTCSASSSMPTTTRSGCARSTTRRSNAWRRCWARPGTRSPRVDWHAPFLDAIMYLCSAVRASGFSGPMRLRMSPATLAGEPFRELARAGDAVRERAEAGLPFAAEAARLRALLDACRRAAASVSEHLEEFGVSVDLVFQVNQLRLRVRRIEALLACVESEAGARRAALLAALVDVAANRRSARALLRHYALLAAKVAERSAETGEHYITRDHGEYRSMLRAAATGGAVLAGTTHLKFLVAMARKLTEKPAPAARLTRRSKASSTRVAPPKIRWHLAGIFNLMVVVPIVLVA